MIRKFIFLIGKIFIAVLSLLVVLLLAFFLYIWISSENHLIQYDRTPCQHHLFRLDKPMKVVIGSDSTINPAFYRLTDHILQDVEEDYTTVRDTGVRYLEASPFKVLGYYSAYLTGPLSGLAATGGSGYLVRSLEDKKIFWIMSSDFDVEACNVCDSFEGKRYSLPNDFHELNITKTEIFH